MAQRRNHVWNIGLCFAADEHKCLACGLRIKKVSRKAVLMVPFPEHESIEQGGRVLSKQTVAVVFYHKYKGRRSWFPALVIRRCERPSVRPKR